MNNYVSVVVALLEKLKLLTEDEAKKVIKDLHSKMLPDTYEAAGQLVADIFKKHDIKALETKLAKTQSTVQADVAKVLDTKK